MPSISEATPVTNGHKPSVEELKLKLKDTQQVDTLEAPLPNPSLQVTADHKLKAVDAPVFAPKAGEVLVHVKATGICGYEQSQATEPPLRSTDCFYSSDVHFWKTGCIGSLVFEGDCIIGHEAAGVVIRCGEGVKDLNPGMAILLNIAGISINTLRR